MRRLIACSVLGAALPLVLGGCAATMGAAQDQVACARMMAGGFRVIAAERTSRFLGKVSADTARCRGGERAVQFRAKPYVDWANYWAAGDAASTSPGSTAVGTHFEANGRGIDGALLDLEYQRIELIKFNLFDNSGTYREYVEGRDGVAGPALKTWEAMRLPPGHRGYEAVGGQGEQLCRGELIRFRTLDGTCNDIRNPLMGATGQPFARNVEFESTFPDLGRDELARNRHGDRLSLLRPDPQVISRKLFTRTQSQPGKCHAGEGLPGDAADGHCDYKKAPAFNVLAAFWIQFMTHDWFSHLEEGHNQPTMIAAGCATQRRGSVDAPLTPAEIAQLGCRSGDRVDAAYIAEDRAPNAFVFQGREYLTRAYKTTRNNVTAWWDASQLYGYDEPSRRRVKRDPTDPAKLELVPASSRAGNGEAARYLPVFEPTDPINPQWAGQEATAFPDNWSIGLSFYHNLFAREHNAFVVAFREHAARTPDADCGLRNPAHPGVVIRYRDVIAAELFEVARLVIAAEIAKIHTTEWTPQLLYDEPLYLASNANWSGLVHGGDAASAALATIVLNNFGRSNDGRQSAQWYSVFASGPGIFGLGSHVYAGNGIFAPYDPGKTDLWSLENPQHVNGGVNHFGSPFNFPEEFVSVYRLHALVPDLIEYRDRDGDPKVVRSKIPVVEMVRGKATEAMRARGMANWALSMGQQRAGSLTLQNHPQFLQNLALPRLSSATGRIDVAALDIIRDRERGVPRFNEFRRQYGLRQLRSFDDFADQRLPPGSSARAEQERLIALLREVYGQHRCDASKIITTAQRNDEGTRISDCLGYADGTMVDNIEDVDTVVGWHAEFTRPHGFAISETQLQVFILNASRRLFSDRFFTSSFRPEFYSHFGVQWVTDNGPYGKMMEQGRPNGHEMEVSPLKRVLLRNVPELQPELEHVVNAFDPWGRERGAYYSLQWKLRPDAASDPAGRE